MKHFPRDDPSHQTSKIHGMIQSEKYILVLGRLDMGKLCLQSKARFVSAHDLLGSKHDSLLLPEYLSSFRKKTCGVINIRLHP